MEQLSDPLKDRRVKNVKPPPHKPLCDKLMWKEGKGSSVLISFINLSSKQTGMENHPKPSLKRRQNRET